MASSKSKSNGASILSNNHHQLNSPHRTFCSSTVSSSSASKPSSMPTFSSPNRIIIHRRYVSPSPTFQISINHPRNDSPSRSVKSPSPKKKNQISNHSDKNKMTCMCSPTSHPGSFRCKLHRKQSIMNDNHNNSASRTASYHSHRLYARRSAMTNSLVRICTVEGDSMKRVLASLIRPSSHQQRRRDDYQPRPSRLSVMTKAGD